MTKNEHSEIVVAEPEAASLDVLTVTYNSSADLSGPFVRLYEQQNIVLRQYFCDNGSSDDTFERLVDLANVSPCVAAVLSRPDNPGFGAACNLLASEGTKPFILLLNPDTDFASADKLALSLLIDHFLDPKVAVVGPRLVRPDGTLDKACKRMEPTPRRVLAHYADKLLPRRMRASASTYNASDINENAVAEVDAVNGAFMLIRRSVFELVGGFDERFWMYAEDLDLCRRVREEGYRVIYDGRTVVGHTKLGSELGARGRNTSVAFVQTMVQYYFKYYLPDTALLSRLASSIGSTIGQMRWVGGQAWSRTRRAVRPRLRRAS